MMMMRSKGVSLTIGSTTKLVCLSQEPAESNN
jgi:hypothetical protein